MTPPTIARRARVQGRVQGVYFRASTAERATALGLRGYARNLADGSVEVLCAGPQAGVEALLDWLREGPAMARVDEVRVETADGAQVPDGFLAR